MNPNLRTKILWIYTALAGMSFYTVGWAQTPLNSAALDGQGGTTSKQVPLDRVTSKNIILAEVTGIDAGEVLDNVSARLKINLRPANENPTEEDIQHFYAKAPEEIQEALKPFGYFHAKVHSRLVREGRHQWKAYFTITPGEAMAVTEANIQILGEGGDEPKFQTLKAQLLQKMGPTLNVKHYEDAKQALYELAERMGFFQAKVVDSHLTLDMARYEVRLFILFDTGPRYCFGPAIFSPTPLSDRFLQRYVPFKVGEPYSELKMEHLERDLRNSNYFQKVSVERVIGPGGGVPLYVNLEVKKARQYTIGGGWGTDTLARGVFGIHFRRLNPLGHQLKTDAIVSGRQSTARAVYIIPGRNPAIDQYRISGSLGKLTENPGFGNNRKLDVSYLTVYKKWHPIFSLGLLDEIFTLRDYPVKQRDKLLIPSFSLSRSHANDPLRPSQGYQINFNVRGANQHVMGKHSFFQTRLDLKVLYSLNKSQSQRILLRGSLAKTDIRNIFHLPLSLQYFAGGPQSVRGYGYLDIGPGKYFSVVSAEFQQRIKGNLYLGMFYDVGSVSNQFFAKLKRSPGVGLIYLSPIGDIEISVAKPLDKNFPCTANNFRPRKEKKFRIQFSMGSELFGFSSPE